MGDDPYQEVQMTNLGVFFDIFVEFVKKINLLAFYSSIFLISFF